MIGLAWLLVACGGLSSPTPEGAPAPAAPAADEPLEALAPPESTVGDVEPGVRMAAAQAPPTLDPLDVGEARFRPLDPADGPLATQLAAFHAAAAAEGRPAFAQLTSEACPACVELREHLDDPLMIAAFGAVDVAWLELRAWSASLDGPAWGERLDVPAFYEITPDGGVGRRITGHAWAENVPENMAPPLGAYFRGED